MGYKTTMLVNINNRQVEAGRQIKFSADEVELRDDLLASGAIEDDGEDAKEKAAPADPNDLSAKAVADLIAIAAAEGATVPEKAKKAAIIAAIEAKRAEVAKAALGDDKAS